MRRANTLIRTIVLLAILAIGSPVAVGQYLAIESQCPPVSTMACECGRWTCPACQQQQFSDPCVPSQLAPQFESPNSLSAPPAYPPVDAMPSDGLSVPGAPVAPSAPETPPSTPEIFNYSDNAPNASTLAPPASSPNMPGPNAASLFAANTRAGGSGAFGSSLLGATTPEMMGDFFGPGGAPSFFIRDSNAIYSTPVPNAGYNLGRMKLAENNSPIPRDRIFFNYSHFTGVPLASQPISVNRYSPGFEKTFLNGLASFEMRTPFGSSLDTDIMANGLTSDNQFQFGNMFLALKGLLIQRDSWLVSAGSSLLLPTAADTRVIDAFTNQELLRIDNKSTHIMPFIGGAFIPSDRLFAQWMVQCDIDANGNPVIATNNSNQQKIGTLQDFTLLYTDLSVGYWLYKSGINQRRAITGIAPVAELHYNRSLTEADSVSDASNVVNQVITDFDNVNIQIGLIFNIRNNSRLGFGYATPLGNSYDRVFDKEFRVTLNRYF